jgi:hypothetical protein
VRSPGAVVRIISAADPGNHTTRTFLYSTAWPLVDGTATPAAIRKSSFRHPNKTTKSM